MVIGYCPTMAPYAKEIAGDKIIVDERESTQEAMMKLKSGDFDCVLVGKKAKIEESLFARIVAQIKVAS